MTHRRKAPLMSRRSFLSTSARIALGLCLVQPAELLAKPSLDVPVLRGHKKQRPDPIILLNTHTREQFELPYSARYCPPDIKHNLYSFLRDHRTGEVHPIDMRLIDILRAIQKKTGSSGVYEVISAFRSRSTNLDLRHKSRAVAKKSLHLTGQAIDVRLTDVSTRALRNAAISLKAGGVGYYASADFVHIDTGTVRTW